MLLSDRWQLIFEQEPYRPEELSRVHVPHTEFSIATTIIQLPNVSSLTAFIVITRSSSKKC